jgi:hypothetical protein
MNPLERILAYLNQTGKQKLTPRQARRADKKAKVDLKRNGMLADLLGVAGPDAPPPAQEPPELAKMPMELMRACDHCGAPSGAPCVTSTGKYAKAPHKVRLS